MKLRKGKSDLDLLQGSWSIAALEMDGEAMPPGMPSGGRIEVEGKRFRSLHMGAVYEGDLTLDETATPKTFDIVFTKGPEEGNTNRAIYEIADGAWRLCLATRGDARPTQFATKANTGHALQTLRRGEAAAAEAAPAESKLPTELEGEWKMVSGYMDGKPMDPMAVQYGVRSFRGNQTKLKFGPQTYITATFTLDASQTPHAIDYAHTKGMFEGKKQLGIYECDGKTLRLSSSPPGQARPQDFEERAPHTVTVFERQAD